MTGTTGHHATRKNCVLAALLLAALSLFMSPAGADSPGIRLASHDLRDSSRDLVLDARFRVVLSDEARDALANGVPLTLEIQARITRPRWWWFWDTELVEVTAHYQLRYHALSRRYVVHDLQTGERRTFFRQEVAKDAWGTVERLSLVSLRRLSAGELYHVEVRARLDQDALPHPLRTVALVSPEWRLVSDWYRWPVER